MTTLGATILSENKRFINALDVAPFDVQDVAFFLAHKIVNETKIIEMISNLTDKGNDTQFSVRVVRLYIYIIYTLRVCYLYVYVLYIIKSACHNTQLYTHDPQDYIQYWGQ